MSTFNENKREDFVSLHKIFIRVNQQSAVDGNVAIECNLIKFRGNLIMSHMKVFISYRIMLYNK